MKSKAPLSLMEQLIMLLVFSLAAALCLQVFVLSSQMSRRCDARNQAELRIQNAAEILKASRGDLSQCEAVLGGSVRDEGWEIYYDAKWKETSSEQSVYLSDPSHYIRSSVAGLCANLCNERIGRHSFGGHSILAGGY